MKAGDASTRTECGRGPALGVPPLARGKKNARRWKAWILFYDESGISQRPSIRRTWAPRGGTPVLIHSFNWKKLLVCLAVGFRWDGRCYQVWFRTFLGSCNRHRVLAYLETLARHVGGRRVILIWDQLPAHKSTLVRDYLDAQRHWLRVEWLPGYAPELNPAEPLWGKHQGPRVGEPLLRRSRRCRLGIAARDPSRAPFPHTRLGILAILWPFFLIELSLYYTRLIRLDGSVGRSSLRRKDRSPRPAHRQVGGLWPHPFWPRHLSRAVVRKAGQHATNATLPPTRNPESLAAVYRGRSQVMYVRIALTTRRLCGERLPRIFPRLFSFHEVWFPRNGSIGAHPSRALAGADSFHAFGYSSGEVRHGAAPQAHQPCRTRWQAY